MEEEKLPSKLPHICIGITMGVCTNRTCIHATPHKKEWGCTHGRCQYYNKHLRNQDGPGLYINKYEFGCRPIEIQQRTTTNTR